MGTLVLFLLSMLLTVGLSGMSFIYLFIILKIFWLYHVACGILVPRPGIKPTPPTVEAWSLNHWTAREVPMYVLYYVWECSFYTQFSERSTLHLTVTSS